MPNRGRALVLLFSMCLAGPSPIALAQAPRSSDVAVGNTARKFSANEWEWMIYVMGDDATLNRISCVTYLLHPTFENRTPRMCQRGTTPGKGFALTAHGWGTFTVGVTIEFADKTQQRLTHDLSFQTEAEGWGVINGTTAAVPVTASRLDDGNFLFSINLTADGPNRKLDSIDVRVSDDGSTGNTAWAFEVLLDGQPWLRIPRRSFSDKASPVRISAASVSLVNHGEAVPRGGSSLRVVGYR